MCYIVVCVYIVFGNKNQLHGDLKFESSVTRPSLTRPSLTRPSLTHPSLLSVAHSNWNRPNFFPWRIVCLKQDHYQLCVSLSSHVVSGLGESQPQGTSGESVLTWQKALSTEWEWRLFIVKGPIIWKHHKQNLLSGKVASPLVCQKHMMETSHMMSHYWSRLKGLYLGR